ncbi:hypothetical protein EsDP_00003741 [Epichloe bromicola]|uniref:Hydroxyacyl-thioester dehydratase type 2, mitochondrial n=1 Tax=Epichloe bromicola TaxID=79588 RepID=A0ABQ0CPM8_9HYPO
MLKSMERLANSLPPRPCLCHRPKLPTHRISLSRSLNTSSSSSSSPINDLRSRAPKSISDYLTPMPSHLLTTTISDLLHGLPPSPSPSPSSPTMQTPGRILPQGHHLVYFPIQTAPSKLGPDGADPDHSPGAEYPRRMWAGGEVTFRRGWDEKLVLDGRRWWCREEIGHVEVRGAEPDDKVFVDVWRRYGAGHEGEGEGEGGGARAWDIEERRTLVFMRRSAQPKGSSSGAEKGVARAPRRAVKAPHKPSYSYSVTPSPRHLFYFSALTFNAHAIHLDGLYARSTDGHRDLLVHGPLTLALMLDALRGRVARITYRNYAPLYVNDEMTVCVREAGAGPWDVWVEGPGGGLAVRGAAVMER